MQEMQETRVWFLCQEDALEKEMATHSNILVWQIPWTEELGGLLSNESQSDMTKHTTYVNPNLLNLSPQPFPFGNHKVIF